MKPRTEILLHGWTVLELSEGGRDEPGLAAAVGGRLLAGLGAKVLRSGPAPSGLLGQHLDEEKVPLPPGDDALAEAAAGARLVLSAGPVPEALALPPGPVRVVITPFGLGCGGAPHLASDLTLFCASGIAWLLTGQVDNPEESPTAAIGYQSAMVSGVAAACAGLLCAFDLGPLEAGVEIDLAMREVLATLAIQELASAALTGEAKPRHRVGDGNGSTVCVLPAADGHVAISPREEHQWRRWLGVMGEPAWGADPRFAAKAGRAAHWDEVHALMSRWTRGRSKHAIAKAAQAAHVPSFPLCRPEEHLGSAQLAARGFFRPLPGRTPVIQSPGLPFGVTLPAGGPAPEGAPAGRRAAGPPLSGIRILDFSWVIAGPTATRYLAALGADVIKIEAPGRGDPGRGSELHTVLGQNKRSVALDLKTEAGAEIARELAASADVVIENFATGVMERFGLGADLLRAANPGLVYVSASGLGRTGPESGAVAYGTLLQCYTGFAGGNMPPGVPPRVGMAWLDPMCGLLLALGTAAALACRASTGRAARLDFSMVEAMLWTLAGPLLEAQVRDPGTQPATAETTTSRERMFAEGIFRTRPRPDRNDEWYGISVRTAEDFERLMAAGGLPAAPGRPAGDLARLVGSRTAPELDGLCRKAGVPGAPVANALDLLADPVLRERGFWRQAERGLLPALPWRSPLESQSAPAPSLGAHTEQVLREILGYGSGEMTARSAAGAFGPSRAASTAFRRARNR